MIAKHQQNSPMKTAAPPPHESQICKSQSAGSNSAPPLAGRAPAHPHPIDPASLTAPPPSPQFSIFNSQFSILNAPADAPATDVPPDPTTPLDSFNAATVQRGNASTAPAPAHPVGPDAKLRRNPIQRLPPDLLKQVNQCIDDEKPFPEILQWLVGSGHPEITEPDLHHYAEGLFQDWVRHQERIDHMAAQRDMARNMTEGGYLDDFNTATVAIAQQIFFDVLNRFDSVNLSKALEKKPDLWFQLINAFCSFSRLQLARDKFEWQKKQAQARQQAREERKRARMPIVITADAVHSLCALMKPAAMDFPAEQPIGERPSPQPPLAHVPLPFPRYRSRRTNPGRARRQPANLPRRPALGHVPPALFHDRALRQTPAIDDELSVARLIPSPS